MLAGIASMRPRDEARAMLIAQMIAAHELAMTFARRLKRVENVPRRVSFGPEDFAASDSSGLPCVRRHLGRLCLKARAGNAAVPATSGRV